MTIEETDKIDVLGIRKTTGEAVLGISDHLLWDDDDHIPLIEKKIGRYLDFIRSGQLVETLPKAENKPVRIELSFLHDPPTTARELLQSIQRQLGELEVGFSYSTTNQETHDGEI